MKVIKIENFQFGFVNSLQFYLLAGLKVSWLNRPVQMRVGFGLTKLHHVVVKQWIGPAHPHPIWAVPG